MKRARALVAAVAAASVGCGVFFDFNDYAPGVGTDEAGADAAPTDAGSIAIVAVAPFPASWRVGTKASAHVTISRSPGESGPVTLTADSLPEGVSVVGGSIADGANEGDLVLEAAPGAHAGRPATIRVLAVTSDGRSAAQPLTMELVGAPGGLDETFGDAGSLSLFDVLGAELGSAVLDGDALMLAGNDTNGAAFFRVTANGSPDETFGDGGVVTPNPTKSDFGFRVAPDTTGFLLLQKSASFNWLYRVDGHGAPVPAYADGGIYAQPGLRVAVAPTANGAVVVTNGLLGPISVRWLDRNGNVTASYDGDNSRQAPVVVVDEADRAIVLVNGMFGRRFFADGGIDPTFQNPALATAGLTQANPASAVLVADGIVVGGTFDANGLLKLDRSGARDTKFGTDGYATPNGAELDVDRDGGSLYVGDGLAAHRIDAKGTVDPTFAPTPDSSEACVAVLVQSTGRIVVVGTHVLRRYWP